MPHDNYPCNVSVQCALQIHEKIRCERSRGHSGLDFSLGERGGRALLDSILKGGVVDYCLTRMYDALVSYDAHRGWHGVTDSRPGTGMSYSSRA